MGEAVALKPTFSLMKLHIFIQTNPQVVCLSRLGFSHSSKIYTGRFIDNLDCRTDAIAHPKHLSKLY
jgi:hypothetical protein